MKTSNISQALTLLKAYAISDESDAVFKIAELAREELYVIEAMLVDDDGDLEWDKLCGTADWEELDDLDDPTDRLV